MKTIWAALILVIVAACAPSSQTTVPTPQAALMSPLGGKYVYYVAPILREPTPRPTPTRTLKPTATPTPCFKSSSAAEFYRLMATDARQQRVSMACDARLVAAAEARAKAQFGDGLSHADELGTLPNAYVRYYGCRLPSFYPLVGNSVESLTAGTPNAQAAFDSLARSPSHSVHIFGKDALFRSQLLVGIAMVEKPELKWRYYWAVITAECLTLAN
jgi:hypothetical protein